ncbi:MAG: hypothetical protein O2955_21460 [Planctomycetota bacterium]|nr:hypothetical protein [Planctomycetota bacterium]MDA1215076.1 hypothetical protein [Planctomycetota bacterium]
MTSKTKFNIPESEAELIVAAQQAVSQCNWVVGECAAKWTEKYARGRTDADFGNLVGVSPDQVYQRRRVWETFGDVYDSYPGLSWSHFYVALNWDDAPECLAWAMENESTVASMKAWRRVSRGETAESESEMPPFGDDVESTFLTPTIAAVQMPGDLDDDNNRGRFGNEKSSTERSETLAGVNRGAEPSEAYAPFRQGATTPPSKEGSSGTATANSPINATEQTIRKVTTAIERCTKSLTPDVIRMFPRLPEKVRQRLISSYEDLAAQMQDLGV